LKIATILGARPQFIKAAPVSEKISKCSSLSEIIIHTGQHYDDNMSKVFFKEMNIPSPKFNLSVNQLDYGAMIEKMVNSIVSIFTDEKIDGAIIYGDTNSTLAGCLACKKFDIPIFHIEAGLRSFNRKMHEENNRIISDHLSSLLFCPSKNAMNNLTKEGLRERAVFSGDVMYDSFLMFNSRIGIRKKKLENMDFVLATIHRRENIHSKSVIYDIFKNLDKINEKVNVVMPLHPHTKKRLKEFKIKTKISFIDPLGYLDMLSFLHSSKMVITDSGGLQKESFFAKKKCLVLRREIEWKEITKTNMLCRPSKLYERYEKVSIKDYDFSHRPFGDGDASKIILESILTFFS
tara:strand:- start:771 stop:1817 length:1047 start_codon:yes stop_codon:yes gene_type:complete